MGRANFQDVIALPLGPGGSLVPIENAACVPYTVNSLGVQGAEAAAFNARTGTIAASTLVTNADGFVSYWLDPGDYNIVISDQQIPIRFATFTIGFLVPNVELAPTYATDIGNGAATVFEIAHNLGTQDVVVSVYNTASPYEEVDVDIQHTDINNVTLTFAHPPAANQYRVAIIMA